MIKINEQIIEMVEDGISWGGSKDTVSRTLNFSVVYQPMDKTLPAYKMKKGDKVYYSEDNKNFFYGYIERIDYSTDAGILNVSCTDLMKRLLKSKCTGRFRGTLVQLANNICGSFGLKNGIESDSQHIHNIVSTGDMSYYDILKTACDVMFERYCLYLDGLTLKLANHDVINTFEIGKNIRSSTFSQSMTDIVNKALIIDNKGNLINTVQNSESINQYGLFQDVYTYDKDSRNNLADAALLLTDGENESSLVVDNDNNCISGRYVRVYEPINNFKGIFEIVTDEHTIGADSSMSLQLEFVRSDDE
jgi:hypothetical protein